MTRTKKLRIAEFLLIGGVMGFVEDLIAVTLATDAKINFHIVWIVLAVAVPFAFISEVIVDHPRFWEKFFPDRSKTS
jgi:hypothetical protein